MPDDRPESPEEWTEQQRENVRGWAGRLREAGNELQRHAGRANDGTMASMPETNRLGRLINTCRLVANHLDAEAGRGQAPRPSSHGDYGCADGSHGVLAALSTPAGPSPEPILKDKSKMTPEDVARYNHDAAPSPREEAVEAAAKATDEQLAEIALQVHRRWSACLYHEWIREVIRAAIETGVVVPLSAARPSSPTPEEEIERRLRASLERFGQHEPLCPAALNAPLATARCNCGYHAALNWFPTPGDDATTKEGR